jgi:hypothetical protein
MGFETLPGAINEGAAFEPLTADETVFTDEELADLAAVKLVVQDAVAAEKYLSDKTLPFEWDSNDDLYRAYVKPKTWAGTDIPRANLGMPIIMEVIDNHLLPAIHMAFFSDAQPFLLEPKGKTSTEATEAMAKVLKWALKKADFKEEMRLVQKSVLQYGFGVGKWGWKTETESKKVYKFNTSPDPNDDTKTVQTIDSTIEENECNYPTFESVGLRHLLVDPTCNRQDIRKAKDVIFQTFITADDLDDLRDQEGYKNIPTREQLVTLLTSKAEPTTNSLLAEQSNRYHEQQAERPELATSANPLLQPLELLERWDGERVATVLQRKLCIRNEEHELGRLPFNSCAFIDVLNSMYGFGVTKLLSGEQRFQQGVINSWIDTLAMVLNPAFQLQKGLGNSRQNISLSPGLIVNENGEMKPLSVPSNSSEAMNAVENSESRATRRVGANGGSEMPNQAMRTAQGVQAFSASLTQKLEYFIQIFTDIVFVPVLEAFADMCKSKLQPKQIQEILTEADGQEFAGNLLDIYNGEYSFDVLVSTQLAARKASAQMLPALFQLFTAAPVHDSLAARGKSIDFDYVLSEALELQGWTLDRVIVDMSPDEIQRSQMQNSGQAVAAQTQMQIMAQKHANDLEDIEQTGMARAGVAVVRDQLKNAHESEQIPV